MDLQIDREAVVFQALDDVDLPERSMQVQRVPMQTRDEHTELALATGVRQGGVANVQVQVDLADGLHQRQALTDQRCAHKFQVPGLWQRARGTHPIDLDFQVVGPGIGRACEFHQPADMHRRVAGLEQQPRCVHGRDAHN